MARAFVFLAGVILAAQAQSQTPPSAAEIAAYDGLHRAAHEGDVAAIERLVAEGKDPDERDSSGRTPAHVAAFASKDEALVALARAGADLNALEGRAYDVVTIAAVANDPELVSLALSLGNRPDQVTSPYKGTVLIAASHLGHHDVVRRLVDAGAPLDQINNLDWTALHEVVILGDGGNNHVRTAKLLLDAGGEPRNRRSEWRGAAATCDCQGLPRNCRAYSRRKVSLPICNDSAGQRRIFQSHMQRYLHQSPMRYSRTVSRVRSSVSKGI